MSEIAIAEVHSKAVATRPLLTRDLLAQETEQRILLGEYVKNNMVQDTDYGVIPGTKNRTLLKPGAEKLIDLFRCTPEYTFVEKIEDFDRPLFHYVIHCKVVSRESGVVIAEGFGSCNSREGKFRWRDESKKCPHCGKATIIKGKAEFGGGWLCFGKKGGCGAKFQDGDQVIEGQPTGRVENDDVATVVNTILKMAKKRAAVDAAISLARCSDMFTQDAEDFVEPTFNPTPAKAPAPARESDATLVNTLEKTLRAATGNPGGLADAAKLIKQNDDKLTAGGKEYLRNVYLEVKRWEAPQPEHREPGDEEPEDIAPSVQLQGIPY